MVEFEELDAGSGVALLAANAGYPDGEVCEFTLERDDFAEGAAKVGFFEPEFVAEFGGLLFGRLVGVDGFDGDSEK